MFVASSSDFYFKPKSEVSYHTQHNGQLRKLTWAEDSEEAQGESCVKNFRKTF